ncbi:hypothetical protein FLM48_09500 [Shewanella sp. Scap07]|uniref:DUF3885 domain-containing protein n=1 Tax=Shewanella sp. Scap07 TaxID=2589987 RepID=UPI0015C08D2A|nr:hypothetical protein [Shewanella sp. Scap07]QLE85300.1 hypothetical protein FLM48_09500 [Shewanella sp. Scap07]
MIKDLTEFWETEFKSFVPEAHNLKHEFSDRWVRFHYLPESKRYPQNEQEYIEVLRRYNTLLNELLGKNEVFVILPEYSESKTPTKPSSELTTLFPITKPWRSVEQHEDDDDYKLYWHLHVSEVNYSGSELDSLFRLVAHDEASNIIIVNPNKGVIFHPYDGGADIVLASTRQRDQLKDRHPGWLPSHSEGF